MFGRHQKLLELIELQRLESLHQRDQIRDLRDRVATLEYKEGCRALQPLRGGLTVTVPSILVGETRVSLEHAAQAQGEAHGRAINEW
jgi:hypothetical protein